MRIFNVLKTKDVEISAIRDCETIDSRSFTRRCVILVFERRDL